jgi:hypothetical protein
MSILKYLSDKCKWGLAFVGSNASIKDYSNVMPSSFIYDSLNLDMIQKVIDRQNAKAQNGEPDKIFMLIDDLAYNSQLFQTRQIKQIFMNGRHLGITCILTLQYALLLPPSARGNTDVIFASQEKSPMYRRKLYDNFSIVFQSFYEFDRVYRSCTTNFETFVMLNCSGNPSDRVTDNVFFFKSQYPLPSFRMNAGGGWWQLHGQRNDPNGSYGNAGEVKKITHAERQRQKTEISHAAEAQEEKKQEDAVMVVTLQDDVKMQVSQRTSHFTQPRARNRISRFS